ncbi:substrate-binding domain-containing protein [Ornithinimicrobium pratense]|uniref:Sugar ABC transporter substrate-binding protein n=1 Tax=Ornithinimicrobium pratense TaxID=2593973 RepID=A0A5J6V6Z6_9MICO|nr:substrate-binding domain-containing protein [Ornithinimicrobium pratense]QFG69578.1 sugar ABC transporter substrate-binding protein [Ornithinimicrobium pratense]
MHTRTWITVGAVLCGLSLAGCAGEELEPVSVGLITKQEENPYWVSLKDVAQETADDLDVELSTATGVSDTDVASQEAALADMVAEGVDGILIAPADPVALLPAIQQARDAGVLVIALDTPVDPPEAVDAFFATDNEAAGRSVGEYAAAKVDDLGLDPQVAMLNLSGDISSGELRRMGFLEGFGLDEDDPAIVASVDTQGDRDNAAVRMTQVLAEHPDINVIYTVNEPAALGALAALDAAEVDLDEVVVVSVDGGCRAMREAVRPGDIDATATQYPQNMAREGVRAIAAAVRDGETVSGFLDTGSELVSDDPMDGVESRRVEFGIRTCWGS